MGDGIMALFGAPVALEDHAVRACYAGLRMQQAVRRYAATREQAAEAPLAIRVGVNSGEIVVRAIGNDLNMDFTVVGETAHLASRMEQMAQPGTVLTTADTVKLAEGYVAVQPLGPVPVKGLAAPVEVYEAIGAGSVQTRLQAAAGRGLTRFVGRGFELEQLQRAHELAAQGRGQAVAIVGEAGVGKSRLVHEFLHSPEIADRLVLEASCASYGRATSYLPAIDLLRGYFGITGQDSTETIREKISDRVLALDPALRDSLPPLMDLLDALEDEHPFRSLDPILHRRHTYQAVTGLLLRESRVQPVVAVIEDLHWIDALTAGLLNELVGAARDAALLLLVTYRPDHADEWRNRPNYRRLRLDPLAGESLADLLEALLGSDPSLPAMKSFLVTRASGNPFFVEEIVRSLVDTGLLAGARGGYRLTQPLSGIEVPPTVRALLAARIDALPTAEKRLLEEASVLGHDAPFALLQAICGLAEDPLHALLDHLEAAEFLYPTQLFPDLQYGFKHALTHDVAYSGVLHERRRDIHARAVDALEDLYSDRLGEQVERLAHHAVESGLREKAVQYLRQAGGKAAARWALADARAWLEEALGILEALPKSREALEQAFEIRLELRRLLRQLGEGRPMLEQLRAAESVAEQLHDERRRGQVSAFMTTVLSGLDELDEAVTTGRRALDIAERLGDLRLRILAASCLEQAYYYRGEYARVADIGIETLAALPAEWAYEYFGLTVPASVFGRAWLIMSLAELGRFAEAAKYEEEAIRLALSTQHVFTIGWAYFAASMLGLLKGDWAKARALVEQWITMLRTANVAIQLPWAVASSAWALARIGAVSEALDRVREAEQLLDRQAAKGIVGHQIWAYGAVSQACLVLGRLDEARRLGDRALDAARRQPGWAAQALCLLGDIASHPDRLDAERATARFREALTLAERHGMRPLAAHCHLGLGRLYRHLGETVQAYDHLTTATTMYREMAMDYWLEQERGPFRPEILSLRIENS
jgi:tetratricopeptide (TPR) repeat protein